MIRLVLIMCMAAFVLQAPARAQEDVGVVQQPQTVAPNVRIDRPQPGSCGAAPSVSQINRLSPIVARMFPQPRAFNDALTGEIAKSCQRNRAAAYLVRVIAANSWAFLPQPGIGPGFPPGAIACGGPVARSTELNAVILKIRPLFANPRPFDGNIASIANQPCADARATLYLFGIMTDNNLGFRR